VGIPSFRYSVNPGFGRTAVAEGSLCLSGMILSRWEGWTDVEPIQQLWETVALCTPSADKPVSLLTDIDGRTESASPQFFGGLATKFV
jgi:hypothetical protein